MTDDIVERLRGCQGVLTHDPECNCAEAADEIERLRAALKLHHALAQEDIKCGNDLLWTDVYREACETTTAALEPKP